ncbi:hypothetical protein ABI_13130 [Asticcacaulis biprosthecium C19]|uniref:Uncharacterized protein n=2 Tax=Asticcacaulis biprosthecium TaxID=76891 RepID=F4QI08_9CAUL|nr:hypothetical protein ABI_13130 [Asticcacaulis biprosthecium C19]
MNMYAYVHGDPVNGTDPTGLQDAQIGPVFVNGCDATCEAAKRARQQGAVDGAYNSYLMQQYGNAGGPCLGYLFMNSCLYSPGGSPAAQSTNESNLTECVGTAYVMEGNANFIGKEGAWGTEITSMSVAIIPRQWTGFDRWIDGGGIKSFAPMTYGTVTNADGTQTQNFSTLTDVVNNKKVGNVRYSNSILAQDAIMARAPGQLVLEVTGGRHFGKDAKVTLFTNNPKGCPVGTQPSSGG